MQSHVGEARSAFVAALDQKTNSLRNADLLMSLVSFNSQNDRLWNRAGGARAELSVMGDTALCFEMLVMTLRCAKGQPFKQDEFDGQTN